MILIRANPLPGPLEGVGPENGKGRSPPLPMVDLPASESLRPAPYKQVPVH
jgi:hypothetical protein